VKKLGRVGRPGHRINGDRRTRTRGIGWEFVHVAVDDATRLAYVWVLVDEKARPPSASWAAPSPSSAATGSCYRAIVHALACKALGIKHLRTRPYRPRTNGKAERFIRTLVGSWAYGPVYRTSAERTAALAGWLDWYNRFRPHRSIGRKPPLTRLGELNNVADLHLAGRLTQEAGLPWLSRAAFPKSYPAPGGLRSEPH
jgi:transposase InsO family protein